MADSPPSTVSFWRAPFRARRSWLAHGVTHRRGGVSAKPYSSLNLGLHVGDDPASVHVNRERVAASLGFTATDMVTAEQVHGGNVAVVTRADAGTTIAGVDGLVTNTPGVLLTLFFADCVPLLFVDKKRRVVGVAHAGWRGMVAGVLEETVAAMERAFDCRPETLTVAIGPHIGTCCFEVGEEVAEVFPRATVRSPLWSRPHVALAVAAMNRLCDTGIPLGHILCANECTSCSLWSGRYFSHRRDNGRTGRMAGVIGIRAE